MGRKIALSIWRYSPNYNGVIRPPVMFLLCLVDITCMILEEKLDRPYEFYTIRSKVWFQCDYCGKAFERVKKSREHHNKIVNKDSCGNKDCTRQKSEEVCLAQRGTRTVFESEDFKQRQRATNDEKYGNPIYFATADFKAKRAEGMVREHDVENPLQSPEIRNKQQETCEKLYGKRNYAQTEEFLAKRNATYERHFGTTKPQGLPQIVEKRKETCRERFNKDAYTQTDEYKARTRETWQNNWGVSHPSKVPENRQKARATIRERYNVDSYSQTDECKARIKKTCDERYGVPSPLCLRENRVYGKTQREMGEWLNSLGFSFQSNFDVLKDQQLDLFDGNVRLAIEYCGLYWHNECSPQPRSKDYHVGKFRKCREKGISLLTVFEDEWHHRREQCKDIIKALLGVYDRRIYARKCKVENITKEVYFSFSNHHHLQGASRGSAVRFGLLHDGELLGVMSLGRHHRQNGRSDAIVLDRLCFKSGVQVIGGASKLFKQCVLWAKKEGYRSIVTWSDNRWSPGRIYQQLGFCLDRELPPDYSYVMPPKKQRLSKQSQKKSAVGCPPEKTELEWATERGLYRIWDCGKKRWKYEIQEIK